MAAREGGAAAASLSAIHTEQAQQAGGRRAGRWARVCVGLCTLHLQGSAACSSRPSGRKTRWNRLVLSSSRRAPSGGAETQLAQTAQTPRRALGRIDVCYLRESIL